MTPSSCTGSITGTGTRAGREGESTVGILAGKRILVTGVLTPNSIAFHVARLAQQQGAEVLLTGFGRMSLVERVAKRLPLPVPPVLELDVTDPEQLASLAGRVSAQVDALDGVLHAIAYAPPGALGDDFLDATWQDASTAFQVSAFSLPALVSAVSPLLGKGSSVVGVDFDATVAWSSYGWMGVAKGALESCSRYLARSLGPRGIRVNLVASGPLRTTAAAHIPGFADSEADWDNRAPLGWSADDPEGTARTCVALFSDWFPVTTGQVIHADGGARAMGD